MRDEGPTVKRASTQTAEWIVGVAAAAWLHAVGIVTGTVVHHILHALPILALLPLRRTRIVRLTAAVLGLMWILMLACISPMIYNSLILGWLFSGPRVPYTWLAPIMTVICGIWAALNISLLRPTSRGFLWLLIGGIFISVPLALAHPLLNAAFELPGQRVEEGEYIWAVVLALEVLNLLAIPWLLSIRLADFKRAEITRRVVLWQIGFWVFFVVCMVAGLLPVFNP